MPQATYAPIQNSLSESTKTPKPSTSEEEYDKGTQTRPNYLQYALKEHFDIWNDRKKACKSTPKYPGHLHFTGVTIIFANNKT